VAISVDDSLPGFTKAILAPETPPAAGKGADVDAPSGTFSYRLEPSPTSAMDSFVFEWYLQTKKLFPRHAYRLDLTVDGSIYSIGNGRTDANGNLTSHGSLQRFADQYCVTIPTPPQPIAGRHTFTAALKNDGAGKGPASGQAGPLTDPGRSFPCDGNGDGRFDYWLVMHSPLIIGADSPVANRGRRPTHR